MTELRPGQTALNPVQIRARYWNGAEQSANFTASLNAEYIITGTCTVTDPTPAQGQGFICYIRNGTATIGGTAYDQPGTMVWRSYHSGAWSNAVLPAISGAYTWTGQQTFSQPILTAAGSASLPSHSFSGDPDTGIYSSGTNQLGIACGGVLAAFAQTATWAVNAFGGQAVFTGRRANGSAGSETQVLSGERVAEFRASGYHDGAAYDLETASVRMTARENYTSTATGTSLEFVTTAIGATGVGVRWRINPTGELVRGDNDALGTFSPSGTAISPWLQVLGTTAATASLGFARFSNDGSPPQHIGAKSRGTSVGTYTATSSGDDLLRISAQGVDTTATAFRESAVILFEQDAAGGASAVPGRVSIHTATSGGTLTEALRVDSAQQVQHLATTASTSTTTGGSTFAGGVGVAGAVYAGGTVVSTSQTAGIGYATGAGGTVTQITSRTTGVTLNRVTGAITLVSAAGSAAWQSFTVTNSAVAATDTIIVNQVSGTDLNMIHVTNIAAGSFRITFATTGGTTVEQPVFRFTVIKSVSA